MAVVPGCRCCVRSPQGSTLLGRGQGGRLPRPSHRQAARHPGERADLAALGDRSGVHLADAALSPGLSMRLLESRRGLSSFAFEHSEEYQQTQHRFTAAVDSMEPSNIVVRGPPGPPRPPRLGPAARSRGVGPG